MAIPPSAPPSSKAQFDPAKTIHAALEYERHLRLMCLLFILGLLAGVVYFVFTRATFTSASLIKVFQYSDTASIARGADATTGYRLATLIEQLNSAPYVLDTAKSMGIAGDFGYNELSEFVLPQASVAVADESHLQVSVTAFTPEAVRDYAQAMIDNYYTKRGAIRTEYRQKAIDRYLVEVDELRQKVHAQLQKRLDFEIKSSITQTQIELDQLSAIPVDIVRTRYRIGEFERVKKVMDEQGASLGAIGQLSLLTSLKNDKQRDPLKTGKIVRASGDSSGKSPVGFINPPAPSVTQVVVEPQMFQGLQPWEMLEKERRATEEELISARVKYGEQNQVIEQLKAKIQRIDTSLETELQVARKAFDLELRQLNELLPNLEGQVPAYRETTQKFDGQKIDFDMLEKSQLAWDKAYEELNKQLATLQSGIFSSDIELQFNGFLNLRDKDPVSPSKFKLAMLGLLLGVAMALGVPFALQKINMSVGSLSQCENASGAFAISVIPEAPQSVLEDINRAHPLNSSIPNPLLEGFRLIRSGVLIYSGDKGNQVVLVTSARPSEGKTTVCANLAWAFASAGEKTIVIDCDLRRGRLHKVMGHNSSPGLVEYLTGSLDVNSCIVRTNVPNLDVISRGALIPGASELLNSAKFPALIEYLRKNYNRVVLDTPPVLGLSETPYLQKHADGAVVVTMADKTPRKDLATACTTLRRLGIHIFGCVLNRVDFTQRRNLYGYYYYSNQYYSEMEPG